MKTDENLRPRTRQFALRIIKTYEALSKSGPGKVIGSQLLRSAMSVGANYAEACRPKSEADFVNKIGTVMQELEETRFWLELIPEAGLLPAQRLAPLLDELDQLMAIFSTMVKKTKIRMSNNKPQA